MILVGDVGGTKTILALFAKGQGEDNCIKKQYFRSADYQSFSELLVEFLSDISLPIEAACIAVAGRIDDGDCDATNLPWVLKCEEIAQQLSIEPVRLINDLEATAWGVLSLPEQDFVDLNSKSVNRVGNIAVLAAGTGLGESIIAWDGEDYHVLAAEGGHADYAPTNQEEISLLQTLFTQYPEHVSCERILSGEGLYNIYQFLQKKTKNPIKSDIKALFDKNDPAAVISEQALSGKDQLCMQTLDMFCRIYGTESGNLALKCLPYGGVYLAGGIAAKNLPFMQNGKFMEGFLAKGRYQGMLSQIPVRICINPEVALLGALSVAENNTGS